MEVRFNNDRSQWCVKGAREQRKERERLENELSPAHGSVRLAQSTLLHFVVSLYFIECNSISIELNLYLHLLDCKLIYE